MIGRYGPEPFISSSRETSNRAARIPQPLLVRVLINERVITPIANRNESDTYTSCDPGPYFVPCFLLDLPSNLICACCSFISSGVKLVCIFPDEMVVLGRLRCDRSRASVTCLHSLASCPLEAFLLAVETFKAAPSTTNLLLLDQT